MHMTALLGIAPRGNELPGADAKLVACPDHIEYLIVVEDRSPSNPGLDLKLFCGDLQRAGVVKGRGVRLSSQPHVMMQSKRQQTTHRIRARHTPGLALVFDACLHPDG